MEDSSGSETSDPLLHRVLSASLDAEKSWFALNSVKCGGKPSRFCSSGFAQAFPDEYRQIALDDLVGCDGFPAPASWFSASSRRAENVYVASAFGPGCWNPAPKDTRRPILSNGGFPIDQGLDQWV